MGLLMAAQEDYNGAGMIVTHKRLGRRLQQSHEIPMDSF